MIADLPSLQTVLRLIKMLRKVAVEYLCHQLLCNRMCSLLESLHRFVFSCMCNAYGDICHLLSLKFPNSTIDDMLIARTIDRTVYRGFESWKSQLSFSTIVAVPVLCRAGWTQYQDSCYMLSSFTEHWAEASVKALCIYEKLCPAGKIVRIFPMGAKSKEKRYFATVSVRLNRWPSFEWTADRQVDKPTLRQEHPLPQERNPPHIHNSTPPPQKKTNKHAGDPSILNSKAKHWFKYQLGIEFYLFVSHGRMKRQRVHV